MRSLAAAFLAVLIATGGAQAGDKIDSPPHHPLHKMSDQPGYQTTFSGTNSTIDAATPAPARGRAPACIGLCRFFEFLGSLDRPAPPPPVPTS